MKLDINLPKELKSLTSIQPGTVFVHDGDVYEKSAETDPDGDIIVMRLSDGTIHRYPECMISEVDVTLVENKKEVDVSIFGRLGGNPINLCSTEHTTSHSWLLWLLTSSAPTIEDAKDIMNVDVFRNKVYG